MKTKLTITAELALSAAEELAYKRGAWPSFLKTASRVYKYPFKDQLLIYTQRPDATACASIDVWNKRMKRWVNKGAKSISLIEDSKDQPCLRYVFDVSDTCAGRSDSRNPFIWEVQENYPNVDDVKRSKLYKEDTNELLERYAATQKKTKSEAIRTLLDKGMKTEGYKVEDDRLFEMVKAAVSEISKPQVERLAAISAKATQISSASYFLLVSMMRMLLPEGERDELDELAAKARKLGIEYLKLRDKDIDVFIRNGIERIRAD
ncbi:MAG: hypothetical protein VB064_12720 [Oscillospiraceae bacterium]|nr:hypothetical protein [Oscillospiraceae bacterium]